LRKRAELLELPNESTTGPQAITRVDAAALMLRQLPRCPCASRQRKSVPSTCMSRVVVVLQLAPVPLPSLSAAQQAERAASPPEERAPFAPVDIPRGVVQSKFGVGAAAQVKAAAPPGAESMLFVLPDNRGSIAAPRDMMRRQADRGSRAKMCLASRGSLQTAPERP